jgi:DNA-binding NarL/FixJ family response regulator
MRPGKPTVQKTRVLIVDDHPMTRAGLVHVINHQPDLVVCGEAESAAQALDILDSSRPNLLLIDITLPGKSGLELIKDVKAMHPELLMLVISMHDESLYADRVLRGGARGYITKHEGGEKLIEAMRRVLSGKIYVSESMSAHILEIFSGGQTGLDRSSIEKLSWIENSLRFAFELRQPRLDLVSASVPSMQRSRVAFVRHLGSAKEDKKAPEAIS